MKLARIVLAEKICEKALLSLEWDIEEVIDA